MIKVSKRLYDYLNEKASELVQLNSEPANNLEEELSFLISQLEVIHVGA